MLFMSTDPMLFLLSSAALLFARLKVQLALSATCFRGIASFDRMVGIKKEFEAFKQFPKQRDVYRSNQRAGI